MKHIGMIYTIKNKINGKQYIGMSDDVTRAMHQHFLCRDNHPLHKEIKEFGEENFECGILYVLNSNEATDVFRWNLDIYRKRYIQKFDTTNPKKGYNLSNGETDEMKRRTSLYGTKNPNHGKSKTKRPIALTTMDGQVIREYESILEAANHTGFNLSNISQIVNGKRTAVQVKEEDGNIKRYTFIPLQPSLN